MFTHFIRSRQFPAKRRSGPKQMGYLGPYQVQTCAALTATAIICPLLFLFVELVLGHKNALG